jgi:hypothetical protein
MRFAVALLRPRRLALDLMCSYCRSRLLLQELGMRIPPRRTGRQSHNLGTAWRCATFAWSGVHTLRAGDVPRGERAERQRAQLRGGREREER